MSLVYDRRYADEKIKKSCEKFVNEALKDARKKFIKSTNLPLSISIRIFLKLKSAKVFCGFDQRMMKNFTLDTFHEGIPEGDFTFYPLENQRTFNYVDMKIFGRKIITTPKNDMRRLITMEANNDWFEVTKMVDDFEYDMKGENLMCELKKILPYENS